MVDDGSCLLDTCLGDVDGDNSVTVSDLLEVLAEFGCTEGCTTDISGDGATTVADLLELLSVFAVPAADLYRSRFSEISAGPWDATGAFGNLL